MLILDANVLLYAFNRDAPQHRAIQEWLNAQIEARELLGLPWISMWAFLRVSTNVRIQRPAIPVPAAFSAVREMQRMPRASIVEPGPAHAAILERLSISGQANGPLITDASLAALAVEHGATLASTDRDFSRFAELKWINPLD